MTAHRLASTTLATTALATTALAATLLTLAGCTAPPAPATSAHPSAAPPAADSDSHGDPADSDSHADPADDADHTGPAADADHTGTATTPAEGEGSSPEENLSPEQANARSIASVFAADAAEWFTAWDSAACTGDRAAEDVRDCQKLLMDLASTMDAKADMLETETAVYEPLRGAAQAARVTADAATDWLDGWCGAYADPACAEPGSALVEAYAGLQAALSLWAPRSTPDA